MSDRRIEVTLDASLGARLGQMVARDTYGTDAWADKHGDIWRLGDDGLMHSFETAPFPPAHVEKKWGPLRKVATQAAKRDADRVRNETRDRLDALDDAATETVLARLLTDAPDLTRQLLAAAADIDIDAVRDAINETGN